MSGTHCQVDRASMHASLHALAQPLTIVSLALTLARSSGSEVERAVALDAAEAECKRAMDSVHDLRLLLDNGVAGQSSFVGVVVVTKAEEQVEVRGAA